MNKVQNTKTTAYEHRLWLRLMSSSSTQIEEELNRLNREFGWRCTGYMPTRADGAGFFILERPVGREE